MNILLGYIPTPEGLAALDWATEHTSLTREIGADLMVIGLRRRSPVGQLVTAGGLLEAEIDLLDVDVRRRDDRAEPEDCKDRQREEDLLA